MAPKSRSGERGSALLIVFVFAAIVAIMLYKQIPDAVFEGERQKEQILMDRGHEYKIGIKRFLARNQRYPTSLDQLDNFNGQRYIRRRYKDPITGQEEWRLIHVMTPGFILTDSKVTPLKNNNLNGNQPNMNQPNGNQSGKGGFAQTNSSGSGNGFGNSFGNSNNNQNSSSFGQSGFGQSGFGQSGLGSFGSDDDSKPDPNAPPEPTAAQLYGAQRRPPATPNESMPGEQNDDSDNLQNEPLPLPVPAGDSGQQAANAANAANGNPRQPQAGQQPGANNNADANNPAAAALNAVNKSMRQPGAMPTSQNNSFGSSTFGTLNSGGGIAGVATKAKGSTIKTMDGQTDLSKWEFVYNPQKDALAGMQGAQNRMGQNANGPNSNNSSGGFGNSSRGFGSSSSGPGSNSSGFGSNSSGFGNSSSGFGSSSSGFGSSSSGFGSNSNSSGSGSSGFGSNSSGFGSSSSGFGSSTPSRPPSR